VYILVSVRIAMMYVIKHTGTRVARGNIRVYILGSVSIAVVCVIKHSLKKVV